MGRQPNLPLLRGGGVRLILRIDLISTSLKDLQSNSNKSTCSKHMFLFFLLFLNAPADFLFIFSSQPREDYSLFENLSEWIPILLTALIVMLVSDFLAL